jgi:N-acetylglucosamine-6-sulfatase
MRLAVLSVVMITAVAAVAAQIKSAKSLPRQPNILLLLTDDQDLVLGGASHMPFLDQHFTQQGTTFRNYFVHTPTCCPSRSSILSGRYLHNIGVFNNSYEGNCDGPAWQSKVENFTFAVYAKQAGYNTGYAGKYLNTYGYNGTNRVPPGWDKWLAIVGNSQYYNYRVVQSDNGGDNATRYKHGFNYTTDYFSDVVANRTLDIIREFTSSPDQPPFLIVNAWPAPHDPIIPAPWAYGSFSTLKALRTPNYNASYEHQQTKHWIVRKQSPINSNWEKFIDDTHRRRLQTLLSVDRHIDQFVKLLDQQGVLDNTIIMYTSDNGFQLGQHRLRHEKYHLYEHDIRVPFVIRGPNIPKNASVYDIALNIDIAPTIYQLVQNGTNNRSVPLPETMDGMSFLPIVTSGADTTSKTSPRQDFLISFHGEGSEPCGVEICPAVIHGDFFGTDSFNNTYNCIRSIVASKNDTDFVYCRFDDDQNFTEYYDLTVDPWQLHNKADELSEDRISALDDQLAALRACSGSACRALGRDAANNGVQPKDSTSSADRNLQGIFPHMILMSFALFALMSVCR